MIRRRQTLALGLGLLSPLPLLRPATAQQRTQPARSVAVALRAVASFSILTDLVREVGGPRVEVRSLVPLGQDPHQFQPSPSDVRGVTEAGFFVINGLGLEGWAERIAQAAGFKGKGVVATKGLRALPAAHNHARKGAKEAHTHGAFDPHAWLDVANVRIYVANIRDGLAGADPDGAATYAARATDYLAKLDALDAEIRAIVAPIPRASRRIVTSHEAFNYYGDAYDVDFLAPVGLSTEQEPTPREFAALIAQIQRERIRAVFLESGASARLIEQIAREAKVKIGGTLYAESLTPAGGPAATYIDLMRANTRMIAAALT
jgi:zinc/manganese transport system substrate-binding protein